MKTLITLFVFCLSVVSTVAQDISYFGDIPFEVSVNECVLTLKKKGCSLMNSDKISGAHYMVVESGELKNQVIRIYSTKDRKISRVELMYPECDSWQSLFHVYTEVVNRLSIEYGQPYSSKDEFVGDQMPSNDIEKMNEVVNGQCGYSATYNAKNGFIKAYIRKDKSVAVQYVKD